MAVSEAQVAVAAALRAARPQDAIDGVKDVVARELHSLDPTAEVHRTEFFNHSFAPDFVLSWKDGRAVARRDVYLRPSVLAGVQGRELEMLQEMKAADQTAPVVLALESTDEPRVLAAAAEAIASSPSVLLTDLEALDDFAGEVVGHAVSPIRTLVKANLVRGGRGLVLDAQVHALVDAQSQQQDGHDDAEAFVALVRQNFNEEAATRIERTAQLLTMARTGDLSPLEAELGENPVAISGRLSLSEMQLVLPYVLSAEGVTDDVRFWSHLGSMVDLGALEAMTPYLSNIDLTRLVVPNLRRWKATRAAISLYTPELEHEEAGAQSDALGVEQEDSKPLRRRAGSQAHKASEAAATKMAALDPRGRWLVHSRMFSTVVGDYRLHVTATGTKLKARDALVARWPDLQSALAEFRLSAVDLDGVGRRLSLTSTSAKADVEAISASVEDDYHVTGLVLESDEPESLARVSVSFRHGLAVASGGDIHVGEIGRMALKVLGYRRPVENGALDSVLPPSTTEDEVRFGGSHTGRDA